MNLYYAWLWLWFLVIKGKKAFIFKEDISWDDRSPWRVKKFLYMSKKIIYYQTIQLLVISWSPVLLRVSTHIYIHIYIQSIHIKSTHNVSTYIYIHLQDPRYRRVALQQSALHCLVWRDQENHQESAMGLKIMAFSQPVPKSFIIGKIIFFLKVILDTS